MCAPGSIKTHRKFETQLYVLSKDEGGRHTPFVNGYRPQLFTRTGDITCSVQMGEGKVSAAVWGGSIGAALWQRFSAWLHFSA